tara:strand:+ start:527 stop:778 length:252 start_codon:yes stop_codon:yes gene_type:complete
MNNTTVTTARLTAMINRFNKFVTNEQTAFDSDVSINTMLFLEKQAIEDQFDAMQTIEDLGLAHDEIDYHCEQSEVINTYFNQQ